MVIAEIPDFIPSLSFRTKGGVSADGHKRESGVKAFVNGIVSPFTNCWQPHFDACAPACTDVRYRCFDRAPAVVSPSRPTSFETPKSPVRDAPSSPLSSSEFVTDNIERPGRNDVLCGRGGSSNRHLGNMQFRELVAANKKTYVGLTKKQKMMVARQIVDLVHQTEPRGRFLAKDLDSGLWYDIGLPRSLEKTSQALREKNSNDTPDLVPSEVSVSGPTSESKGTDETGNKSSKSSKNVEAPPLTVPPHLMDVYYPKTSREGSKSQWQHGKSGLSQIEQPYLRSPYPPNISAPTSPQGYGFPPRSPYTDSPKASHYCHSPQYSHHDSPQQDHREHYDYHTDQYFRQSRHRLPPQSPRSYRPYSHAPHMAGYPARPTTRPLFRPVSRQAPPRHYYDNGQSSYGYPTTSQATPPPASVTPPVMYRTPSNGYVRGKAEVSPERRQEWKRQRNDNGVLRRLSETSLSNAVKDSLTLEEQTERHETEISSPSGLLQGRSKRTVQKTVETDGGYDRLAGLAALSTAAFLKLDETS